MLSFKLNPDLKGYTHTFTAGFFNSEAYQKHQMYAPLYSFYILREEVKEVYGHIHFTLVGETAVSQPNAPFGGFELDPLIDEVVFLQFHDYIHSELKAKGVRKIHIVDRPDVFWDDVTFDLQEELLALNYNVVQSEISHYINLEEVDGLKQIHSMERRNFRKAMAKNYRWKLEAQHALPEVYSFIERCRGQQELKVNIAFEDLRKSFKIFPGKYRIFSIRHHDYLTAASITVEISKNVLYNYLPASDKRFNADSPMVFLLVSLFKYAKSLGYQILDLGISSVNGKIQTGLAEFKERMGALICERKTFEKIL